MSQSALFTQRVEYVKDYNERRDCADQRISAFLLECGCLPVPVPNHSFIAEKMVDELCPSIVILTGGNSLVKYGGNAPERDKTDAALIEASIRSRIPVFGFCRGMQSILDYFGSSMINVEGHTGVEHVVSGYEGKYTVNSYHNQGCIELNNDELKVLMRSADNVIEMVRHRELPIAAVMWHPERTEGSFSKRDIQKIRSLIAENAD